MTSPKELSGPQFFLYIYSLGTFPILPFLKKIIYYLFIYIWPSWVFIAAHGLPLVAVSRGYSAAVCGLLIAVACLC